MASKAAVYASKRAAGRKKDADVLAKFEGIHPADLKQTTRERYRATGPRPGTNSVAVPDSRSGSDPDASPGL